MMCRNGLGPKYTRVSEMR